MAVPQQTLAAILWQAYRLRVVQSGREAVRTPPLTDAIRQVARWLGGEATRGLLLLGGVGNGKSTLLQALYDVNEWYQGQQPLSRRMRLKIYSASQIANEFRDENGQTEKFYRLPLLGVDDLGIEPQVVKYFGTDLYPLADVLHRRSNEGKLTVITTNLDGKKIRSVYGPRVYDRLRDMEVVKFTDSSFRGTARRKIED